MLQKTCMQQKHTLTAPQENFPNAPMVLHVETRCWLRKERGKRWNCPKATATAIKNSPRIFHE